MAQRTIQVVHYNVCHLKLIFVGNDPKRCEWTVLRRDDVMRLMMIIMRECALRSVYTHTNRNCKLNWMMTHAKNFFRSNENDRTSYAVSHTSAGHQWRSLNEQSLPEISDVRYAQQRANTVATGNDSKWYLEFEFVAHANGKRKNPKNLDLECCDIRLSKNISEIKYTLHTRATENS